MRITLFISLLFWLLACDPNVDLENINAEKLISVTCFISPQDSLLTAYLFWASPIGSTIRSDSAAVKVAEVTISDGVNYDTLFISYEIDPDTQRKIYKYSGRRRHLTINANSNYTLNINVPQEGIHATATCTIPPGPDSVEISGSRLDDDYLFFIEWNNPSLHKYFLLALEASGSYQNPYPGATGRIDLKPSLFEEIRFPSDKQVINNKYDGILTYAYLADTSALKVTVKNIDQGMYKYFKSYRQFETWDSNNSGSLFPNFKDVPLIYSNVNGGVGIFGAWNSSSRTIKVK